MRVEVHASAGLNLSSIFLCIVLMMTTKPLNKTEIKSPAGVILLSF